jgi:hypothetical protein
MGLDMYAWSVNADLAGDAQVDLHIEWKESDGTENPRQTIHYWRKHHNLHGWMANLYAKKGGVSHSFNCDSVRLTLDDLNDLEKDVVLNRLPETSGFFFGNNPPDEDSKIDDLNFIKKARQAIADGKAVFYDSWW